MTDEAKDAEKTEDAEAKAEDAKTEAPEAEAEAGAEPEGDIAEALDFARGEVDDEDLRVLETAVDNIDFATRKATPERLERLQAISVRLGDLCEQIAQGKRKPRPERAPLTDEEEARYTTLVEEGLAAGERGNLAEARSKFEDAVLLDPEGVGGLYNLGVVYGLLAHMNVARMEFFDDYTRDEVFVEKAKVCYDKVLEIRENHLPSLNNLATLYAMRDERDLAVEILERMLTITPAEDADKKYLDEAKNQLEELKTV
jgi:tetratricopeptide (TPR) repeat protein